ncbi:MAG: FMN-binding protein [Deltaproteobacteria bacterium]|nr:FMN-binding protein [Deltaproteobacteria bacterium]
MKKRRFFGILLAFLFATAACSIAPVLGKKTPPKLLDGVYEGRAMSFPNSAHVRVTIKESYITVVELVRHIGSSQGKPAVDAIPGRIVTKQSTDVDAVSGATNSSRVIMNATEDAISKALPK